MREYRNLAWPFYLTGLVIIAFPAVEFVLTVSPLSPSILSWRYGVVGLLSRSIMAPLVGVVVIFGTAVLLEHTWAQRGVMVLGFVGSALLLLAMAMFVLDVLQFRHQVRAEARTAYEAASAVALMRLFAGAVVLLAFGVSGLQMARRAAARKRLSGLAPLITRPGQGKETTPDP